MSPFITGHHLHQHAELTFSDGSRLQEYRSMSVFVLPTLVFALLTCSSLIHLFGLVFAIPTVFFCVLAIVDAQKYELRGGSNRICLSPQ